LEALSAPGLVLFTSGSTGMPKGVVHNFSRLLEKFKTRRGALITLNLLMFDHWGGLNTLLHGLANDCLVVLTEHQNPEYVCALLEKHKVELLPATPSFLNMMLISQAYEGRDLSALRLISYGAEPMPDTTLNSLRKVFPNVETRQTYGLIELGVLRAKSKSSDSLWVKIGGEGYNIRVVDDMLEIKADAAMLGYLNAPSPFTDDGYFMTGDRVEVNGDYFHILGRDSELINVGGQKVYPAEVESVLMEMEGVVDATVSGEPNPLTGQIVVARVVLTAPLARSELKKRMRAFCRDRLAPFKLPVKVTEFDINTKDEAQQAEDTRRFYKICFAHPAVAGITMWGFWEGRHWRPEGASWRRDWSIKPNGEAYLQLMEEWRSKGEAKPDKDGDVRFRGFFGEYEVISGDARARVVLHRDSERSVSITLQPKPEAQKN